MYLLRRPSIKSTNWILSSYTRSDPLLGCWLIAFTHSCAHPISYATESAHLAVLVICSYC